MPDLPTCPRSAWLPFKRLLGYIDEILAGLINHQVRALAQLLLIVDLVGLDRMTKLRDELLTHHFVDIAFGLPLRHPEVQMPTLMRDRLQRLASADAAEIAYFLGAAAEARDQVNEVWRSLAQARDASVNELTL